MPQIDTSEWNIGAENRKAYPPPPPPHSERIIEGNATDITHRLDLLDDTTTLVADPIIPDADKVVRDREDTDAAGNFLKGLVNIPFGPLRNIKPEQVTSTWRLIEILNEHIPMNDLGMPIHFYRPDLLDFTLVQRTLVVNSERALEKPVERSGPQPPHYSPPVGGRSSGMGFQELQQHLDSAISHLSYHEGYPTTQEGTPFWNQLTCESSADYAAFQTYLELGGARKISDIISYPLDYLRELFHTYCWAARVKSFDLYRVVNAKKLKLQRILGVEDSHFTKSERMLKRVADAIDAIPAETLESMDPDKLLNMFEKLVKVQRVSVGLPANGGNVDEDAGKAAPTTVQITQKIVQNAPETAKKQEDDIDILRNSPDSIEQVQDLLIQVMKQNPGV